MIYFNYPINHIDVNDVYSRIIEGYREKPEADWHVRNITKKDGTFNIFPIYYEIRTNKFVSRKGALEILENQLRSLEERL